MDQVRHDNCKICVVRLSRFHTMEDADVVRDRILDDRVRKCKVMVRRCDTAKTMKSPLFSTYGQFKILRCRVRLPRLNTEVFDMFDGSSRSLSTDRDNDSEHGHNNTI